MTKSTAVYLLEQIIAIKNTLMEKDLEDVGAIKMERNSTQEV